MRHGRLADEAITTGEECASCHMYVNPNINLNPHVVARRRVTNPFVRICERWLPFLPSMRENRARHAKLYQFYEDMLDQLEVGGWALPL